MVTGMTMGSKEAEQETNHELSIGTLNFDFGWPTAILDLEFGIRYL